MDERDVTHQMNEEAVFRALAKNASDGIAIVDAESRLIFANQTCHERFGYDYGRQEMVGLPVIDLWPEEEAAHWREEVLPRIETDDWQGEVRQRRRDGALFEAQVTVFSIEDGKGGQEHSRPSGPAPSSTARWALLVRDVDRPEVTPDVADLEREIILDSVSEHVIYQDTEHRILWSNRAACESVDATREELTGLYCYQVWPQRDDRCPDCPVADAMAVGRPQQTEKQTPDGRYWFIRGYPVHNAQGELIGGIEVTQDITEREKTQRRLRDLLERRGRQVQLITEIAQQIAATPAAAQIYDRVVTLVKESFDYYHVQIFRYDDDLDAMRVVEGYGDVGDKMKAAGRRGSPGHHLPYGEGVVGTAAATGEPVLASDVAADPRWKPHPDLPATEGELAVPIKLRDEVLGVLDVQSDEAGALTEEDSLVLMGLAGQIATAIESASLLAQVQRSEERYRSYIDNAPDGVFISDEEGRYLEVNEAACRITGYSREELLGMRYVDLLPPESMEGAGKHFGRLAGTGKATGDFKFLRKDGSAGYWTVDAVKLSDTRFLGFAKDITERKQTERMLSDRVKELNLLTAVGQRIAEDLAIPDLFQWVAERIPPAMQYPDVCVVAIEFEDQMYGQPESVDLSCRQQSGVVAALRVSGETVGRLYVAYEEERDFLDEESAMLGGIVRRLESYIERRRATQELENRARQLAAVAEVAGATGIILDPDELIQKTVDMVRDRFDLYYVGLFLVDNDGEWAVLRTGSGEAGRRMVEERHKLAVGGDSMVGWCVANREARIALDVGEEAVRFDNPYLPETRSELALPVMTRGEVVGAISIQSVEREAFSEEDITVFQTMVDQVATAIENARLFEQTQEALARAERLYEGSSQVTGAQTIDDVLQALVQSTALQRLDRVNFLLFDRPLSPGEHPDAFTVRAVWERSGEEPRAPVGTRYDFDRFPAGRVVDRHGPTIVSDVGTDERIDENTRALILERLGTRGMVFWPLVVGEQWIGVITGQAGTTLEIGEREIRQITGLTDQAAAVIQTKRLLEQTEARARQEQTLREITARVRGFTDPEAIVRTAVRELGTALGRPTFVRLGSAEELSRSQESEDGSRRSANGDFAPAPGGDGRRVMGTDDVGRRRPRQEGGE